MICLQFVIWYSLYFINSPNHLLQQINDIEQSEQQDTKRRYRYRELLSEYKKERELAEAALYSHYEKSERKVPSDVHADIQNIIDNNTIISDDSDADLSDEDEETKLQRYIISA